jgi:hypothetical protein
MKYSRVCEIFEDPALRAALWGKYPQDMDIFRYTMVAQLFQTSEKEKLIPLFMRSVDTHLKAKEEDVKPFAKAFGILATAQIKEVASAVQRVVEELADGPLVVEHIKPNQGVDLTKEIKNIQFTATYFQPSRYPSVVAATQKELVTTVDFSQAALAQEVTIDLKKHFGSIYVINLPDQAERRHRIAQTFASIGLTSQDIEFFPAVDGRTLPETIWKKMHFNWQGFDLTTAEGVTKLHSQFQREAGCYMSHLKVIETIRKRYEESKATLAGVVAAGDAEKIAEAKKKVEERSFSLIFEDDTGFGLVNDDMKSTSMNMVSTIFQRAMTELSTHCKDWDLFYLQSWARDPSEAVSEHLVRLNNAILNNAFAISHRMYDKVFTHLNKINDPNVTQVDPLDDEYSRLHHSNKCYGIVPSIAYQEAGLSSITGQAIVHLRQTQSNAMGTSVTKE